MVRDLYAGITPNDIDAVIYEIDGKKTLQELTDLYGMTPENPEDNFYVFTDEKNILTKLELLILDNIYDDDGTVDNSLLKGPIVEPDFDVNCLAYQRFPEKMIYNWTGSSSLNSPDMIISNIKKRIATFIGEFNDEDPDEDFTNHNFYLGVRIDKMETKPGWTVVIPEK